MKRYVVTAALFSLCAGVLAPEASAKSAIVIVVENNQKAAAEQAPSPLVVDSAAVLAEGMLHRMLTREMKKEVPASKAGPTEPKFSPKAEAEPKKGKKIDDDKPELKRNKRAKKAKRNRIQDWIGEFMPDVMSDVIEPNLDKFGEPFYARLLELAAARYWDRVVVLSDTDASFKNFAATVRDLDEKGYLIDVVVDIHGGSAFTELGNSTGRGADRLYFTGKSAKTADVLGMGQGKPLNLNAIYSVACWGSRFNEVWIEAGADAANGSRELNYYVLVSPLAFVYGFGQGQDLHTASERAYEVERRLLDRRSLDQALAPMYGNSDATHVQTAASSERVHKGPKIKAACHND
jgi:hypothetical protein